MVHFVFNIEKAKKSTLVVGQSFILEEVLKVIFGNFSLFTLQNYLFLLEQYNDP